MSEQNSSPDWLPVGWTTEVKIRKTGQKDKAVAEGLPFEWIKGNESKKGCMIRKDPYYTDPVSGYVFRSRKEVDRYVKTGQLGRIMFKPKDKGHINVELGDDKLSSHAVAERQNLADSGTNRQINGKQSPKLVEIVKGEQTLDANCTADSMCLSEHVSDQCREDAAVGGAGDNLSEAKGLEQSEGNSKSTIDMFVSRENLLSENGVERHENIPLAISKSNRKREPALPRRASKRLAGIKIDPLPDVKTTNRTRRVPARRSVEAETTCAEDVGELAIPEELPLKVEETDYNANEKQEQPIVLPLESQPIPPEEPLNLSLTDLWTDPCVEFAVKTLTGAIPIGDENKADENNTGGVSPLGDFWTDPCIEFAVKTLTGGASPVRDDLCIEDYFLQQVSSSQSQGDNCLTLPNVGLDNFCQTDLLSQHFGSAGKPIYEQQDLAVPVLPQAPNVSLPISGDSGLCQHVDERSGESPRPTVV